jgi:hypothetical protein
MSNSKKINVSSLLIILIFGTSVLGLSFLYELDQAESYSIPSQTEKTETPPLAYEDQIVRTFVEIDTQLMAYFDELRNQIGSLFIISFFYFF